MTFEEAWTHLMDPVLADTADTPELAKLKQLACAFYKAGEIQGVENSQAIVKAALSPHVEAPTRR